jgi:hypothetical protein
MLFHVLICGGVVLLGLDGLTNIGDRELGWRCRGGGGGGLKGVDVGEVDGRYTYYHRWKICAVVGPVVL